MNDWARHFYPQALHWLTTGQPYTDGSFNPIWTMPTLAPLFFLPVVFAYGFALLALGYYAYKRRKPHLIPIVGLSSPFVALVIYANIDWLVFLGIAFADWRSPILLTIKPQSGVLALLAILKGKSWWDVVKMFAPLVLIATVLTIAYPTWISDMLSSSPTRYPWNLSPFPWLIPFGIYLGYLAYKNEDMLAGVVGSLCIAPYFHYYSLTPALLLLAERHRTVGLVLSLLSWIPVILLWRA